MRRTPGLRQARTAASCVMVIAEVRPNLADQFLGDLGQIVILTGVAGDLLEDALLGLGGERRGAPGHHGAASECLHLSDLLSGRHVPPWIGDSLRSVVARSLYRHAFPLSC